MLIIMMDIEPMVFFMWLLASSHLIPRVSGVYKLISVRHYTALSDDIHVEYRLPTGGEIPGSKIEVVESGFTAPYYSLPVTRPTRNSTVTFKCGIIDHAGEFYFRLAKDATILAETQKVIVYWPDLMFSWPRRHIALTNSVGLRFQRNGAKCESFKNSKYYLDVVYYGEKPMQSDIQFQRRKTVYRKYIYKLTSLDYQTSITFNCSGFESIGYYQALLYSSYAPQVPIGESNPMQVISPKSSYTLTPTRKSIFPCNNELTVVYGYPRCIGNKDKIRIYSINRTQDIGSRAFQQDLTYLMEHDVIKSKNSNPYAYLRLPCDIFDFGISGYCLRYVSVASNDAVTDRATRCVSSHEGMLIDGKWGSWSHWTACTTQCGQGERLRYRLCDSPPPSGGGTFCEGKTVDHMNCLAECPDSETYKFRLPAELGCDCGCHLNATTGIIDTSGYCTDDVTTWRVFLPRKYRISLRFEIFDLDPDKQKLVIWSGEGQGREMMLRHTGDKPPDAVSSKHNVVTVQLTFRGDEAPRGLGFKAKYTTFLFNGTDVNEAAFLDEGGGKWQAAVAAIGGILCVAICVAAIAFLLKYRKLLKNGKLCYAPPTTPEKQQKSTFEINTIDGVIVIDRKKLKIDGDEQKSEYRESPEGSPVVNSDDKNRRYGAKDKSCYSPSLEPLMPGNKRGSQISQSPGSPRKPSIPLTQMTEEKEINSAEENDTSFVDDPAKKRKSDPKIARPRPKGSLTSLSPKSLRSLSLSTAKSASKHSLNKAGLKALKLKSRAEGDGQDTSPTSPSGASDITPLMARRKKGNLSRCSSRNSEFHFSDAGNMDDFEFDDTVYYEPGSYFQGDDTFIDPCELDWRLGTMKTVDDLQTRDIDHFELNL